MRKDDIVAMCLKMTVGQCLTITRHELEEACAYGFPTIYRTAIESLLSALPGSGWGGFTVTEDFHQPTVTIQRHTEGDRLVYVDPDREHLVRRTADGFLEPIP